MLLWGANVVYGGHMLCMGATCCVWGPHVVYGGHMLCMGAT